MLRQSNVLIISTQKPDASQAGKAPRGKTGMMIQALTGAGMISLHRSKMIESTDELTICQNHISNNSWIIITGHGGTNIVGGGYRMHDNSVIDVTCSPRDYADLICEGKTLAVGDHLNILLYVCKGAYSLHKSSFAEELGAELARKGIASDIYASIDNVGRIYEFNPKHGDQAGVRLQLRTVSPFDLRRITTKANEPESVQTTPAEAKVFFTKDGIEISRFPSVEALMQASLDFFESTYGVKLQYDNQFKYDFNLNTDSVDDVINMNRNNFIIRKSSSYPDHVVVSFYDKNRSGVFHFRLQCVNVNGRYELIQDEPFPDSLNRLIRMRAEARETLTTDEDLPTSRKNSREKFNAVTSSESAPIPDKSSDTPKRSRK